MQLCDSSVTQGDRGLSWQFLAELEADLAQRDPGAEGQRRREASCLQRPDEKCRASGSPRGRPPGCRPDKPASAAPCRDHPGEQVLPKQWRKMNPCPVLSGNMAAHHRWLFKFKKENEIKISTLQSH